MDMSLLFGGLVAILVIVVLIKTARVVPQREQFVVERLGKYSKTLDAGFHILCPCGLSRLSTHTQRANLRCGIAKLYHQDNIGGGD